MPAFIDLTGRQFAKLFVMAYSHSERGRRRNGQILHFWKCKCVCGTEKVIEGQNLRRSPGITCGCGKYRGVTKHGCARTGAKTPEYRAWAAMRTRCANPKATNYSDYGGRGISICDRWTGDEGFANFLADMGVRPSPRHSLDRHPNGHGNYEPGNCRWATKREQANNTRRNRILEFGGRKQTISEWARELGISQELLQWRVAHWALERALSAE